jgi:hypothetical protein
MRTMTFFKQSLPWLHQFKFLFRMHRLRTQRLCLNGCKNSLSYMKFDGYFLSELNFYNHKELFFLTLSGDFNEYNHLTRKPFFFEKQSLVKIKLEMIELQ